MSSDSQDTQPVQNNKPAISHATVTEWLRERLGRTDVEVEPLAGGFWSAAFAYEHEGEALVVRFNENADGFRIDQAAHAFAKSGLPIPEVLEIGSALGLAYAISRRHHGRFLETVEPELADRLAPALADMFVRMRRVQDHDRVEWYNPDSTRSWHDYLLRGIDDDAGALQDGWHAELARRADLKALYRAAVARIHELLPLCPERRDLVHGDLLHQNVLVSAQAERIEAVFSWKCSTFGDFAYDIAWCSHWAPWHPGIAAIDFPGLTAAAEDLDQEARQHLGERLHCYQLQIAASHIGWYLWTRDEENLALLTQGLAKNLQQGPQSC